MAKILLDDDFYYGSEDDIEYRKKLISLLSKHVDANYVIFQPSKSFDWSVRNMKQIIELELMKSGDIVIYDSNELSNGIMNPEFLELSFSESMVSKINYILAFESDDIIIPLPTYKHYKDIKKISECIYIINHISQEFKSNIAYFISEKKYIKNIETPSETNPLPNNDLCDDYHDVQKKLVKGKNCKEQEAIYLDVGCEVLKRNQYKYNQHVSNLNRGAIRKIFSYLDKNLFYTSIDIEHGAIEVFDSNGKHKDEFTYNNQPQNKQDKSGKHDINI